MTRQSISVIHCVFLDLLSTENGILSAGQWSERGCNRSESLSNSSVSVCECNHLTHFAIFLDLSVQVEPTTIGTTDAVIAILKQAESDALQYVSIVIVMLVTHFINCHSSLDFWRYKAEHDTSKRLCM